MISNFDLFISRLHVIVQKCFCFPDGSMDPTYKMKYVLASMFAAREIRQTRWCTIHNGQKWHMFLKTSFSIFSIRFLTLDHKIKSEGKLILPSRTHFRPQNRGFKHRNKSKLLWGFFCSPFTIGYFSKHASTCKKKFLLLLLCLS